MIKRDRYYYKMQQLFYYNIRQKFITKYVRLFIIKCSSFITVCDSYKIGQYKLRYYKYKLRQYAPLDETHLDAVRGLM